MERQTVSSSPYFYRTQQKNLQKQAQQYVKMFALPGSFIFLSSRFPGLYIPACFRLLTYSAMAFKSRLHIYSDRIAEDLHFVPFSSVLTYRSLDKISYAYFKNNLSYLICYCKKIFCMCFQFSDFWYQNAEFDIDFPIFDRKIPVLIGKTRFLIGKSDFWYWMESYR